jgi:hypothetical protein
MKKFLLISFLLFTTAFAGFTQDDDAKKGNEKIRDRMNEFIQKRLDLTKDEAAKFSPVFLKYFKEWRQTLREYKGDKLVLQQKIVDLRLRYRTEFRAILGEQRGDRVYQQQDIFIKELKDIRNNRIQNGNRSLRRPA